MLRALMILAVMFPLLPACLAAETTLRTDVVPLFPRGELPADTYFVPFDPPHDMDDNTFLGDVPVLDVASDSYGVRTSIPDVRRRDILFFVVLTTDDAASMRLQVSLERSKTILADLGATGVLDADEILGYSTVTGLPVGERVAHWSAVGRDGVRRSTRQHLAWWTIGHCAFIVAAFNNDATVVRDFTERSVNHTTLAVRILLEDGPVAPVCSGNQHR